MKLRIDFKDPDLISAYLDDVVPIPSNATEDQEWALQKKREKVCDRLFDGGDYGCVEIDTKTGKGRLVPVAQWRDR